METLPSGACASSRATSPPCAARSRSSPSGWTSPSACWRRSGTGLACRRPEGFSPYHRVPRIPGERMKVGVPKETAINERRVALVPETVGRLVQAGLEVLVERGAGEGAFSADEPYRAAAATPVPEPGRGLAGADAPGKVPAAARGLGAVVSAFDVRPAVKEQVESVGASFVAPEAVTAAAEAAGGYAAELGEDQHRRELELIHRHIRDMDVVITTALIPGRPAPRLITGAMVRDMRAGAVIM